MCWHAARGGNPDLCVVRDCLLWVHLVVITLILMSVIATVTACKLFTHMYTHTHGLPHFIYGSVRAPCGEQKRNVIYSCLLIHTIAFPNRVLQTIRCIPLYHFLKIALFPSAIIPTSWLLIHQCMLPDSELGKLPSLSVQITTWILLLNSGVVKFSPFAKRGSYNT